MLVSIGLVCLVGLVFGGIFQKLHLPPLIGLLLVGILLGPHVLNVLSLDFLTYSADFRELALVIILTRAGLSLDLHELKQIGRPAVLMCFFPALIEIIAVAIFAQLLLGFSFVSALLLGSILAAVSPAIIVPRMLKLIQENYGQKTKVPQLILAGASVDDVFVLVLFTTFLGLEQGNGLSIHSIIQLPISIFSGIIAGVLIGYLLSHLFKFFHLRDSVKVLILLSSSFLLMGLEDLLKDSFAFSGILAVLGLSLYIRAYLPKVSFRLANKFAKLWIAGEILLFVLVGASVNLSFAVKAGFMPILLIMIVSLIRMAAVGICLIKTRLTVNERLFCMISYLPKATVQAAIGGIPFALGLPNGEMILSVAVLSILITAPIGAILMDSTYRKLLSPLK